MLLCMYMYRPLACHVMYCGKTIGAIFYRPTVACSFVSPASPCWCTMQGYTYKSRGHSHSHFILSYDHSQDAVKGSWHFLGVDQVVFWTPSLALLVAKRSDRDLHMPVINRWSDGQWVTHRGQAVEAIFWWPGNEATLGEKPPLQMAISKYGSGIQ